jgi:hypothetical protein
MTVTPADLAIRRALPILDSIIRQSRAQAEALRAALRLLGLQEAHTNAALSLLDNDASDELLGRIDLIEIEFSEAMTDLCAALKQLSPTPKEETPDVHNH